MKIGLLIIGFLISFNNVHAELAKRSHCDTLEIYTIKEIIKRENPDIKISEHSCDLISLTIKKVYEDGLKTGKNAANIKNNNK